MSVHYKGYVGMVNYDADAEVLHGEVMGLRDVVTFQAQSAGDVRRAFCESIDDYLAFCRERGESPDKPSNGQFLVRMKPELHRAAAAVAESCGMSLNTWVVGCLNRAIADGREEGPPQPGRKRRASISERRGKRSKGVRRAIPTDKLRRNRG